MDQENSESESADPGRDRVVRGVKTAVIAIAVVVIFCVFVYRAVNPTGLNHLVLIRHDGNKYELPFHAAFVGGITWKQELAFYGRYRQGPEQNPVGVADISRAWFDGELIITDGSGQEVARVEIKPPGRYSGTLVIVVDEDGQAHAAFNELPSPEL